MSHANSFGARATLDVQGRRYEIFRLDALANAGVAVEQLPYGLRILLENLLRNEDGQSVTADDILSLARWDANAEHGREIDFSPARVLLQDFTGVPAVVDLATMRDALAARGGDPGRVNPIIPVELVIDHSIQVDAHASADALTINRQLDYQRNLERYAFLKWAERAFERFAVVPPNTGICHQVNLEHLARVVFSTDELRSHSGGLPQAYPDTVVGTDSHTPMVNGLGVLGWGVGGIEAEAAMLGHAISLLVPRVVGVRLSGARRPGVTATDLVLTVTELLRGHGVVGQFVEFVGPGLRDLSLADRATIGNMSPEYGATCTLFPVDEATLEYLRLTGRSPQRIALVEAYMKEQGLFHRPSSAEPRFSATLELDLASVEPSIAGPGRPQDRIALCRAKAMFERALPQLRPTTSPTTPARQSAAKGDDVAGTSTPEPFEITHGSVVIAAITSCTNTSNPAVMLAAGLLARNAVARGLRTKPWVKTSLAPGSKVVTEYYARAGLTPALETLGFHVVAYGCTTCIGNSGPLPEAVSNAIATGGLVAASVLSGNRNFEGRIHPEVRANYLMSPPLVIAFAIAGRIDVDLERDPLGHDDEGRPVYLADVWPAADELRALIERVIEPSQFERQYRDVWTGDAQWRQLTAPAGQRYAWAETSTYVRRPPYFELAEGSVAAGSAVLPDVIDARVLVWLGDSVTTDHISPAGFIAPGSPAGQYLLAQGVPASEFNSYGARRGNHEVMVRGTFANPRIRNRLVSGEGGMTLHIPSAERTPIYDAAMRYRDEATPLIVLAGHEYGSGSSRDWAAKGPYLLGVRAVIARSYERIHRSNLVGMGILPLQFDATEHAESLGLSGQERFSILGIEAALAAGRDEPRRVTVEAHDPHGLRARFTVRVRIDTPQEAAAFRRGGILQHALHELAVGRTPAEAMVPAGAASPPLRNPPATAHTTDVDEASQESFPASDPPSY